MKEKRIVVALGRNAFGGTFPEQKKNVKKAAQAIADLLADAEVRGGMNLQQLACANAQRTGRAACVVEGKE